MSADFNLGAAVSELTRAFGANLLHAIRSLELELPTQTAVSLNDQLANAGFTAETLQAALGVKRIAGQINVMVHTAGILAALPCILEEGEVIEYVSLGAGNTGKDFDLATNVRVAEFKFIQWRRGPQAIRQNQVFKDYLNYCGMRAVVEDSSSLREQRKPLDSCREAEHFKVSSRETWL